MPTGYEAMAACQIRYRKDKLLNHLICLNDQFIRCARMLDPAGDFHSSHRMDAETLAASAASDAQPPAGLTATAHVLWLAKSGRWHNAHDLCQDLPDPDGAWVHAWLHREEGDFDNACYWYERAGKPAMLRDASMENEWFEIARALLQ